MHPEIAEAVLGFNAAMLSTEGGQYLISVIVGVWAKYGWENTEFLDSCNYLRSHNSAVDSSIPRICTRMPLLGFFYSIQKHVYGSFTIGVDAEAVAFGETFHNDSV